MPLSKEISKATQSPQSRLHPCARAMKLNDTHREPGGRPRTTATPDERALLALPTLAPYVGLGPIPTRCAGRERPAT
jgi:hypothetical protein